MSGLVTILLIAIPVILIGVLVGFTGLIPPLRRAGRAKPRLRDLHTGIGAVVAFESMVALATVAIIYMGSGVAFFYAEMQWPFGAIYPRTEATVDAVVRPDFLEASQEAILRELIPLHGQSCTKSAAVCQMAIYLWSISGIGSLRPVVWVSSLFPAALAVWMIRHYTRKPDAIAV